MYAKKRISNLFRSGFDDWRNRFPVSIFTTSFVAEKMDMARFAGTNSSWPFFQPIDTQPAGTDIGVLVFIVRIVRL